MASVTRKTLTTALAALSLGAALTVTTPSDVEARSRRGAGIAAGVIGGLAAGALIGAATRPAYGYGAPAYGYDNGYGGAGYGVPAQGYGVVGGGYAEEYESCRIVIRERVNRFGEVVQIHRRVCN